jgi:uncharacterized protein YbjT (DUF2867 family)
VTRLLIVGGTGLVGNLVLEQALADERVDRVIALTRRGLTPRDKLENVVIDFADMPNHATWWEVDGMVSALGTTRAKTKASSDYRVIDHSYPLAIAKNVLAQGATRLAVVSSLGANPNSRFAYTRTKGALEEDLKALGFLSLTIVRPSVLSGHREHVRFDELAAQAAFHMVAPVLPRRWRISPAGTVAATLLEGAVAAPAGIFVKTNDGMVPDVQAGPEAASGWE